LAQSKWALVLWIAATGVRLAAANPEIPELPSPLSAPPTSGWVLADFNGDLTPDLASARLTHHDARGYWQEVCVKLGSGQTSFYFRSRAAKVELSAWDIDGDDDSDIVVLEALSKRPVGVWLNDGAGSFDEGNLERFSRAWGGDGLPAWRIEVSSTIPLALIEQRSQCLAGCVSAGDGANTAESLPLSSHPNPLKSRPSTLHARAPPFRF